MFYQLLNFLTFSAIIFGLLQNDIIDCDISDSYPIGFTDCNSVYSKDRIAEADCGKAAMNIHAYTCMYCTCVYNDIRYQQSSMCRYIAMTYSYVLHVCAMPEQLVVHVHMMQSSSHKLLQNIEV